MNLAMQPPLFVSALPELARPTDISALPEELALLEEKEENCAAGRRSLSFRLSFCIYLFPFLLFLQFLIVCSVCVHHEEGKKEETALGCVMS